MAATEILLIAVGLSMDAFAVALAAGASGRARGRRAEFRISFHFGLFQFAMPVLGWFLAHSLQDQIESVDHWIAFGLLSAIGLRMIIGSGERRFTGDGSSDPSRGSSLVALSVATSVDALAVGITLSCIGEQIIWPSGIIGLTAALFSFGGMRLGGSLHSRFGEWLERAGGVLLFGIGARILVSHLWGI